MCCDFAIVELIVFLINCYRKYAFGQSERNGTQRNALFVVVAFGLNIYRGLAKRPHANQTHRLSSFCCCCCCNLLVALAYCLISNYSWNLLATTKFGLSICECNKTRYLNINRHLEICSRKITWGNKIELINESFLTCIKCSIGTRSTIFENCCLANSIAYFNGVSLALNPPVAI